MVIQIELKNTFLYFSKQREITFSTIIVLRTRILFSITSFIFDNDY